MIVAVETWKSPNALGLDALRFLHVGKADLATVQTNPLKTALKLLQPRLGGSNALKSRALSPLFRVDAAEVKEAAEVYVTIFAFRRPQRPRFAIDGDLHIGRVELRLDIVPSAVRKVSRVNQFEDAVALMKKEKSRNLSAQRGKKVFFVEEREAIFHIGGFFLITSLNDRLRNRGKNFSSRLCRPRVIFPNGMTI